MRDSSARNAPTSQVWQADPDKHRGTERLVARANERATDKDFTSPNLSVSSEHWTYVERVLRNVRRKLGVPEQETTDQICINKTMWGILMNYCMWAAVHLDKD